MKSWIMLMNTAPFCSNGPDEYDVCLKSPNQFCQVCTLSKNTSTIVEYYKPQYYSPNPATFVEMLTLRMFLRHPGSG